MVGKSSLSITISLTTLVQLPPSIIRQQNLSPTSLLDVEKIIPLFQLLGGFGMTLNACISLHDWDFCFLSNEAISKSSHSSLTSSCTSSLCFDFFNEISPLTLLIKCLLWGHCGTIHPLPLHLKYTISRVLCFWGFWLLNLWNHFRHVAQWESAYYGFFRRIVLVNCQFVL